jgi:hypothetical protein
MRENTLDWVKEQEDRRERGHRIICLNDCRCHRSLVGCSNVAARKVLTGSDHFVEQREHSRMAYCVVDINERGGTVAGTQSFVPKLVGRI